MPSLNLRWVYKIQRNRLNYIYRQFHLKESASEDRLRTGILKHAILEYGSIGLLESVHNKRRSESTDSALIDDFQSFEQPDHPVPRDSHYLRALKVTERIFRPSEKLHPVSFPDLRYFPWTKNVSAEAPYTFKQHYQDDLRRMQRELEITDSSPTFHNLEDVIFNDNRILIHKIKDQLSPLWEDGRPAPYFHTTLHARAHVVNSTEPDKIRAVFGVPKLLLMAENMFIWTLQAVYLNSDSKYPLLWGNEIMKGGWKKLYSKFSSSTTNTVLSLDWSQFDKRALHEVIDDTHSIWRSYFDFTKYEPTVFYPTARTDPSRIENLWTWMTDQVKHYPILLPNGDVYQWTRNGIASGFMQTQLLDSFVNTIMILTVLSKLNVNIESKNFLIKVQGDDSLIAFPERYFRMFGPRFLEMIAETSAFYFNAKLSTTKSFISDSAEGQYVLGYFNRYGIPYRYDDDLLAHLVFPERSQRLEETAATCVGLAMASMGCSKIFYSICSDVHRFIVDELGREPSASTLKWMSRSGLFADVDPVRMPTFDEVRLAAYQIPERTTSQKERLWPTTTQAKRGFHFLRNVC